VIAYIKSLYRQPTPLEVIARELAQSHLALLEAESAVNYAQSIVDYNRAQIDRLNKRLKEYSKDTKCT
jgi:hypothetical protein